MIACGLCDVLDTTGEASTEWLRLGTEYDDDGVLVRVFICPKCEDENVEDYVSPDD